MPSIKTACGSTYIYITHSIPKLSVDTPFMAYILRYSKASKLQATILPVYG